MEHRLSASEACRLLRAAEPSELPALLDRFRQDPRAQVVQACGVAQRRLARAHKEEQRLRALYDRARELSGGGLVLGADEVGRGPLAGPLCVGAVALDLDRPIAGLNDSKQVPEARRSPLAAQVRAEALAVGVACVDVKTIDRLGMARALRLGFSRALAATGLAQEASCVVVDGLPLGVHEREVAVVKGDSLVAPVAAASLVAKVFRDDLMTQLDARFPGYGFASHKGYGSQAHIEAIRRLGLSPVHRRSFCGAFVEKNGASPSPAEEPRLF